MPTIKIDDIDVGIPTYRWVMGRMSDEEFKKDPVYKKLLQEGFTDKDSIVDSCEKRVGKYLDLPLLVEPDGERYRLRDGYHRLCVLHRRGATEVECEFWEEGMTKKHWEYGRLIDIQIEKGMIDDIFPQKKLVKGEPPYHMYFEENGKRNYIDSFLIYTGVKVPHVLLKSDGFEARGDDYVEVPNRRKLEFLVGVGKHAPIAKEWGTHPLNSYLVGHFACGPNAEVDPLVQRYGRFVRIQQYFRGGRWGFDVPGYKYNGVNTVREQIIQTNIGVQLMFKLGILKADTKIYFADQSADKPCDISQYFRLFQGEDVLEQYYEWLPTYFRVCRSNHFNKPIEEVIACVTSMRNMLI